MAEGLYVKDLDILANRDLKNVILVDNAAYSYSMQLKNGVPIIPFYKSKEDTELIELCEFLLSLKDEDDVSEKITDTFKSKTISKYANNLPLLNQKLFDI